MTGGWEGQAASGAGRLEAMLMLWACVQLWVKDGRGWVRLPSGKLKADSGGLADLYMEMLLQGKHSQISDFDDHLNDLAK